MWNEKKNVDQEGQKGDQQGGECQNEQSQEVARRVSRRVEVSSDCQCEANERQEGRDRVDDEDGRKRGSRARGQRERIVVGGWEEFVYKSS